MFVVVKPTQSRERGALVKVVDKTTHQQTRSITCPVPVSRPATKPIKWFFFQTHPVHRVTSLAFDAAGEDPFHAFEIWVAEATQDKVSPSKKSARLPFLLTFDTVKSAHRYHAQIERHSNTTMNALWRVRDEEETPTEHSELFRSFCVSCDCKESQRTIAGMHRRLKP